MVGVKIHFDTRSVRSKPVLNEIFLNFWDKRFVIPVVQSNEQKIKQSWSKRTILRRKFFTFHNSWHFLVWWISIRKINSLKDIKMYLLPVFVTTRVEEDVEGEVKSFQIVFIDVYFLQIGTKLLLLLFFPLRRTNKKMTRKLSLGRRRKRECLESTSQLSQKQFLELLQSSLNPSQERVIEWICCYLSFFPLLLTTVLFFNFFIFPMCTQRAVNPPVSSSASATLAAEAVV